METFLILAILFIAYLLGSIPFGLLIVRLRTGKDIRQIESGRTGGTNVARAAGFWSGLATAILDLLKGAAAAWLARWLVPGNDWLAALAPLLAILGHNYSLFLAERAASGQLRLRGGAGGAPAVGGALGLWAPSILIIIPLAVAILFGIGYASLATISVGVIATLIFAYRAWSGLSPWAYVLYGLLATAVLVWALRPNIARLLQGTERLVGWRAGRKAKASKSVENELH